MLKSLFTFALLALSTGPAVGQPYTWQIYQTSLTATTCCGYEDSGIPVPGFVPGIVGTLTLDDTALSRGTVGFLATSQNPSGGAGAPFLSSGDTDFDFDLQGRHIPILGNVFSVAFGLILDGYGLDGSIDMRGEEDELVNVTIKDSLMSGFVGSDGIFLGCDYNRCGFTATMISEGVNEQSVQTVPEPTTMALLTMGLLMIPWRLRQRG